MPKQPEVTPNLWDMMGLAPNIDDNQWNMMRGVQQSVPPKPKASTEAPTQQAINEVNSQANQRREELPPVQGQSVSVSGPASQAALMQKLLAGETPTQQEITGIFNNPERKAALERMIAESEANYGRTKSSVGEREKELNDYMAKAAIIDSSGTDLTGALELADIMGGGSSAKGYVSPADRAAEQQKLRQGLREKLESAITGLSAEQRAMFKSAYGSDMDPTDLLKMMMTQRRFEESQGTKWSMKDSDDLYKLQKDLSGPLGDMKVKLESFPALLPKPGEDIPGIGPIEKNLPKFWQSDRGIQLQQLVSELTSAVARKESGLTVTDAERAAILGQLGQSRTSPERALPLALERIKKALAQTVRQKTAGFRKNVVDTYRSQEGYDARDIDAIPSFTPPKKPKGMSKLDQQIKQLEDELAAEAVK